jgi:pyruvate dehydrogenase phosphatase regulatory subunit
MLRTIARTQCIKPSYQRSISCSHKLKTDNIYEVEDGPLETVVPPRGAKVVVCGGGVMGASVVYNLAKLGWGSETVLIEQNRVGGGTTWHSSGLIGVFKPSLAQVKLTKSSVDLYKHLESKGLSTGWKQCGSLNLARTRDRMTVFRRMKAQSVSWKIDCELLTPQECQEKCPLLNVDDLVGGLWIPGDGVGDPYETCLSVVGEAKKKGS